MEWWVFGGIALVAVVVALLLYRRRRQRLIVERWRTAGGRMRSRPVTRPPAGRASAAAPAPRRPETPAVEQDEFSVLVTMVLGDREKAERLVAYEAKRQPGSGRAQLIQNAIERLRYDRR
jgi:hypothetical protein